MRDPVNAANNGSSTKPKDLLAPNEYRNYRNIKAVAALFVLLGSVLALGGILLFTGNAPDAKEQVSRATSLAFAIVGLFGAAGGIGALLGRKSWAKLVYVMAVFYIFVFPVGTILSCVMFAGLSRYLDSTERIRNARTGGA